MKMKRGGLLEGGKRAEFETGGGKGTGRGEDCERLKL